jgi:hypothetical protein
VDLIAEQVREMGRRPWIFSAAGNAASIRGLEKTGFQQRYSLVRRRWLGWERVRGKTSRSVETPRSKIAAGAEDSAA